MGESISIASSGQESSMLSSQSSQQSYTNGDKNQRRPPFKNEVFKYDTIQEEESKDESKSISQDASPKNAKFI